MAFTAEQKANAKIIAEVGRQLGASERDVQIAIMTALVESNLVNVNYGDRDSLGLFQQRAAWSAAANRMNPYASAKMFFTGGEQGQRGLFDFKNRDQMGKGQAAQAVQVSAFPDRYAERESDAAALLGSSGDSGAPTTGAPQVSLGPGEENPAGTITLNPVVDQTASTLAAQRTKLAPTEPLTGTTPGIAATVAPGAQAVTAPGTESVAAPGATPNAPPPLAATPAPPEPATAMTLTREQFHAMFPDAAQTRQFSDPGGTNQRRGDVISQAMGYIGTPYAWGGNSYDGIDCSGLVQQVYKGFGIDLPRLSADQMRSGARVGWDELRPGDLVGVDNSDRNNGADHIAVWAGDGYIIEAPRTGLNVRRRKLTSSEMQSWYGVHIAQLG